MDLRPEESGEEVILMVAIAFSIVSGNACLFLIYALVRFHQELRRLRPQRPALSPTAAARRIERKVSARLPSCVVAEDPAQLEVQARRQVLVSGVLGFLGFAAPFIFILLLNSSIFRR
jgi:hypothetical protein